MISNQPEEMRYIEDYIACLRTKGATGIDVYEKKLKDNAGNSQRLNDLLFEGRAAYKFLCYGFSVCLRDSPDIEIKLGEKIAYVEVKHFYKKQQDAQDEGAMENAADIMPQIGDLTSTEGREAWQQIIDVAIKKAKSGQYMEGSPNILLIESESSALELMAKSAANEYDDEICRCNDSRLRRLSAIMIVNATEWIDLKWGNVELCEISKAVIPLGKEFLRF